MTPNVGSTQWGTAAKYGKVKSLHESTLNERIGAYEGSVLLNPTKSKDKEEPKGNCSKEHLDELSSHLTDIFNEIEQDGSYSSMAETIVDALLNSRFSSRFVAHLGKRLTDYFGM